MHPLRAFVPSCDKSFPPTPPPPALSAPSAPLRETFFSHRSPSSPPSTHRPLSPHFLLPTLLLLLALLALLSPATTLHAQTTPPGPEWWRAYAVVSTTRPAQDYAAINQGQLKNLATKAATAMNARLPGGAGTEINALIARWQTAPAPGTPPRADYAAVTTGQLKAVALPFYRRLQAAGRVTPANYPWAFNIQTTYNDTVANIGQAKNLFSFSLPGGTTPDGRGTDQSGNTGTDNNANNNNNNGNTNTGGNNGTENPNGTNTGGTNGTTNNNGNNNGTTNPNTNTNNNNTTNTPVLASPRPFYAVIDLGPAVQTDPSTQAVEDVGNPIAISEKNGWIVTKNLWRWNGGTGWKKLPRNPDDNQYTSYNSYGTTPDISDDGIVIAQGNNWSENSDIMGFQWNTAGNRIPEIGKGGIKFQYSGDILYQMGGILSNGHHGYEIIFANRKNDIASYYTALSIDGGAPKFYDVLFSCVNNDDDPIAIGVQGENNALFRNGITSTSALPERDPDDKDAGSVLFINAPQSYDRREKFYTIVSPTHIWYRATDDKGKLFNTEKGFPQFAPPEHVSNFIDSRNFIANARETDPEEMLYWENDSLGIHAINDDGLLTVTAPKGKRQQTGLDENGNPVFRFQSGQEHLALLVPANIVHGFPNTETETFEHCAISDHPGFTPEEISQIQSMTQTELKDYFVARGLPLPVTIRLIAFNTTSTAISKLRIKDGEKEYPLKKFFSKDSVTGAEKEFLYPYDPARPDEPKLFLPSRKDVGPRLKAYGYNPEAGEFNIFTIAAPTDGNGTSGTGGSGGGASTSSNNNGSGSSAPGSAKPNLSGNIPVYELLVDANRDGKIDDNDKGIIYSDTDPKISNPWRFWINDDSDNGDVGKDETDIPDYTEILTSYPNNFLNTKVDGRCDLPDFFPVWMDTEELFRSYPPSSGTIYVLKHEDEALNIVVTYLKKEEAVDYQTRDTGDHSRGPKDTTTPPIHERETKRILKTGLIVPQDLLSASKARKGILFLLEGRKATTKPLVLEIEKGGKVVFRTELALSISPISEMYRWINLRHVMGEDLEKGKNLEKVPTNTAEPPNWPDKNTVKKHVIMVHGFINSEDLARGWAAEGFKRFFWSGSKAMFTMVTWRGDQGSALGYYNYWRDVRNAFASSKSLAKEVDKLPPKDGQKIVMAHSLGNIITSSAIQDHNMDVQKYFMLNAATPVQAYGIGEERFMKMIPGDWRGKNKNADTLPPEYDEKLFPSNWWKLFVAKDDSKNILPDAKRIDDRSKLTWINRFGDILTDSRKVYNFYATTDEIVANSIGDDKLFDIVLKLDFPPISLYTERRNWAYQEMSKGGKLQAIVNKSGGEYSGSTGGWVFNSEYDKNPISRMPAERANLLADSSLRVRPFFQPFREEYLYQTYFLPDSPADNQKFEISYEVRSRIFADDLPATSRAAGANPISAIGSDANFDMASAEYRSGWPKDRPADDNGNKPWLHSDLKHIAYYFNYKLWKKWVEIGELNKEN